MSIKLIKIDIFKILLIILSIIFVITAVLLFKHTKILELDKDGLAQLESLSSNIQRLSKLELENSCDDILIAQIDEMCTELIPVDGDNVEQCFEEDKEMAEIMTYIVDDWVLFKSAVMEYRTDTSNRDILFSASEKNYSDSTMRIKELNEYVEEYTHKTDAIQYIMIADIVFIGLILLKILMSTHKELQDNKNMSEKMYIDTATGIYNRSKCQEIMKTPPLDENHEKNRAVIIFDLNDLKKTNDNLGHRAGDQLIYDFAQQVKNATDAFSNEIFVGRYGGDEFLAFLDNIEEEDVENYIQEVNNLMKVFNETEEVGYKLSCAGGYGITTKHNKTLTVKQLFDVADEDMYRNKIAMKEKKKQELLEQGIEVVEEVDDRLQ